MSLFFDNEMTSREMFLPQKIHFTYKDSVITNRTRDWGTVCLLPVEFSSTLTYRWFFLLLYIIVFRLQKSIKHIKHRQLPTYLSQPVSSTQRFTCRYTYKTVQLFRLQRIMFLTLLLFRQCLFNSIGFTLSFVSSIRVKLLAIFRILSFSHFSLTFLENNLIRVTYSQSTLKSKSTQWKQLVCM